MFHSKLIICWMKEWIILGSAFIYWNSLLKSCHFLIPYLQRGVKPVLHSHTATAESTSLEPSSEAIRSSPSYFYGIAPKELKDCLQTTVCAMCLVWHDLVTQPLVIGLNSEECVNFQDSLATHEHQTGIFGTAMLLNVLCQERRFK